MLWSILFVIVGLGLLAVGAEAFVEGAARVATRLRVSPVIIGAVFLGFGTSAPELLVSGLAAGQGDAELGLGNAIGSNVANLSLVLGCAALTVPLAVRRDTLRREAPLAIGAMVLFAVLLQNGLDRVDGLILLTVMILTLAFLILTASRNDHGLEALEELHVHPGEDALGREVIRSVIGLVATVGGAQLLVDGATDIAADAGLSTGFVGLTLVAIGTSLPELVTSVIAARKGHTDLIVGNLLGSNIFNSLAVGATVALIEPRSSVDGNLAGLATALMLAVGFGSWLFMATERRVVRWEAVVLLGVYLATMPFLASDDDNDNEPDAVLVGEVAPAPPSSPSSSATRSSPSPLGDELAQKDSGMSRGPSSS